MKNISKKKNLFNKKLLVLNSLNFKYKNKKNFDDFQRNKDRFLPLNKNINNLKINFLKKDLMSMNKNLKKKGKISTGFLKSNDLKFIVNKHVDNYFSDKMKKILGFKKVNVFIIKLEKTFSLDLLDIINPKKNSNKFAYIIQKGSILEVNASSLGLITKSGALINKVRAKVTNIPYRDGCVNCVTFDNFDFKLNSRIL